MKEQAFWIVLVLDLFAATGSNGAGNCGERQALAKQLIKHGTKAIPGAWPWHGAMFHQHRRFTEYACGVTILTEQFVVTAAHCTIDQKERQGITPERLIIKIGLTNLNSPDRNFQQHKVSKIIRHYGYDEGTFENDIALLKLYTEIKYNDYVQPICLWQGDSELNLVVSKVGYILGWGFDDNEFPTDLNEAPAPIVSRKTCFDSDKIYYAKFYFEPKTFCAGYRNGTQAAAGDSGGGLFLLIGQQWFLRGIISTAKLLPDTLNVDPNSFGLFTDAAYYTNWIKMQIAAPPSFENDPDIKVPMINTQITADTSFEIDPDIKVPTPSSRPSANSGSQTNLLGISNCGSDTYPPGTPEEIKGYLNQYPWLAVIEYINTNTRDLEDTCHGVLIHLSFLVTAAHCVQKKRLSQIHSVRMNDYTETDDLSETTRTTADRIPVRETSIHPSYNNPKYANNIALIKLERSTRANPICLPARSSTLPKSTQFTIIGWKKNSRKEKPMIRRNVVQLADFAACQKKYAEQKIVLDTTGGQVCGTYSYGDDDSDSCSHYMGSTPFQYVQNGRLEGRYFLAAISSFGHGNCQRHDFSDVFTNVAHYADWILENVRAK